MSTTDTIEIIIKYLPATIVFQGATFHLQIIHNYTELRICYSLEHVVKGSQHWDLYDETGSWENPFPGQGLCDFLYLRQGIENIQDLQDAVIHCMHMLQYMGFLT